jgi:26S proteasome regulatory subunit N1
MVMGTADHPPILRHCLPPPSEFYAKEANHLFTVRIAQGLNAAGKGLLSLGPCHSDRLLMNGPAVGALLTFFHAALDIKNTFLDKLHYLLFFLAPAMNPRFMQTVDADLTPVTASVRVGQAVETVGQAGRPKTISGFQTHTTPVLLGHRDRAELAGQDWAALTSVLEHVVIVEKVEVKEDVEMAGTGPGGGSGSATASAR